MAIEGQRFSVIPSRDGCVHYAYDQAILRAFNDRMLPDGLQAVCGG